MCLLIVVVLATALLSFVIGTSAQQLDPIKNMCTRFDHQSIIKNNTLYIDGGIQTFRDLDRNGKNKVGKVTVGYNNNLIAIDLSRSWDWKKNISQRVITKKANPRTGSLPPISLSRGALYHGTDADDNIYLWGGTTSYRNTSFPGWVSPFVPTYSLWSYNIVADSWDQFDVTLNVPNRPSSASSAEVPELGLAFYFNGEIDYGSAKDSGILGVDDKVFLGGMIVIDTKNQTARNISTSAVSGELPRTRGELQYVPGVGKKGILIQIGGNQKPVGDFKDRDVGDLIPMDQIDLFDIGSLDDSSTPDGVWYKQRASGTEIPAGRLDFCLFYAVAPDKSSRNIYMYGGRGDNNAFFDDMWVLSLPSFTWTKLYEGKSPRFAHTCHQVGERTLLTVGGIVDFNMSGNCDWEYRGVGVMDISSLTWGSIFDANPKPYEVPGVVFKDIGGSAKGNATKTVPMAGFSSPALAALFHPTPKKSKRGHAAVIAGAVVGSFAFLAVVGAMLYLKRNRIKKYVNGPPNPAAEIGESEVMEIMDREVFSELDAQDKRPGARGFLGGWRVGARGIMHGGARVKVAELDTKKDVRIGDERNAAVELDAERSDGRKSADIVPELDGKQEGSVVAELDAKRRGFVDDSIEVPAPAPAVVKDTQTPKEGEWF